MIISTHKYILRLPLHQEAVLYRTLKLIVFKKVACTQESLRVHILFSLREYTISYHQSFHGIQENLHLKRFVSHEAAG